MGKKLSYLILTTLLLVSCPTETIPDFGSTTTTLKVDSDPPKITSYLPENFSTVLKNELDISATFNEQIDEKSINKSSVFIENDNGELIQTELIYDNNLYKVKIIPFNQIENGRYYVTISTDIKDLSGNNLEKRLKWAFIVN